MKRIIFVVCFMFCASVYGVTYADDLDNRVRRSYEETERYHEEARRGYNELQMRQREQQRWEAQQRENERRRTEEWLYQEKLLKELRSINQGLRNQDK